ncbi:MAG: MraY family glycosyltransferase [Galactobacter sp.]|uniref:MraY family glycosyltransferase n=1 Tax=Galactobacter sp. TaxID=2676125 RepID=UPI0025BCB78F|nr:MraY family glycosyltransferase [Galactobacter sp.]
MRVYLLMLAVSFAVSACVTPLVRAVGMRTMADIPLRSRDMHHEHIPKLGGVAMIAAVLVGLAMASQAPFLSGIFTRPDIVLGLVLALLVVLVIGVADDLFDLHWSIKMVGQFGTALLLAFSGVRIEVLPVGWFMLQNPFWQIAVAVLVMVAMMNAINFVDGLDGLAAGIAAIGASAFFLYCYLLAKDVNQYDHSNLAALLMVLLLGASLGFLVHNFNPAKIFMGETGAQMIGLVMAVAAISVTTDVQALDGFRFRNVPAYMPILLPLAVILIPVIDMVAAVIRRTARGTSPFTADRGHLHHKLVDGGYTHRGAVLLLYVWSAIVAFGTVSLNWIPATISLPVMAVALVAAALVTASPWIRKRFSIRSAAKARRMAEQRRGRL